MGKEITEINKDTFWQFIEEAKGQCGKDMDAMLSWIKGRLSGMQPEQILKFYTVLHGYRDAVAVYPKPGDRFVTRYGIQCFFMGSTWNASLPGMKELVEKGADEARKFRRKQQRKNQDKKKKQDGQSR